MSRLGKAKLESALAAHYAAQREDAGPEPAGALVAAMMAEDAKAVRPAALEAGLPSFIASQARYIPVWVWAAQCAIAVLMVWLAGAMGDSLVTKIWVGILSAASVLVCVPTLYSSKANGVAELEYACVHNAASVLVARLVVMGCSCALCVAVMVAAGSSALEAGPLAVAAWACPPFFCSCSGALMLLRRVRPSAAASACVAWVAGCCLVVLTLGMEFPVSYGTVSVGFWLAASAAAFAWLAREAYLVLKAAADGLDSFSPHTAVTYN